MNKVVFGIIVGIIAVILFLVIWPGQECGTFTTATRGGVQNCDCLGLKYSTYIGGGPIYCKGLCLKNTCKAETINREELIVNLANAANPLIVPSESVNVKKGESVNFVVVLYNKDINTKTNVTIKLNECISVDTNIPLLEDNLPIITTIFTDVRPTAKQQFNITLDTKTIFPVLNSGTYLCSINAVSNGEVLESKSFNLIVN